VWGHRCCHLMPVAQGLTMSSPVYRKGHSEIGDLWTSQTASSFLGTNPKHQCFFFCVSNLFTSHWPLRVDGAHVSNNLGISLQHILAQAKSSQHLWLKENHWLFNWPKHLHFHQELTSPFAMYAKNPLIRVVVASVVHRTKIQWTFKVFQLCYAHFRSFSHF